ncbi:MAG TPA: DUF971 domain-containing protein [Candidatus Dormibacteraeota bacterium]|nr:DUF971 domain-containing protein [Candidatus Dormibacteraeota bacterium]
MRDPDPFPTTVDLVRADNILEIAWEDGARTSYAGRQLRWACPCAECRGEAGVPGRLDSAAELDEKELKVTDVGLIGQYALQIGFASGHATGIYTFRYLRNLADLEGPRQ